VFGSLLQVNLGTLNMSTLKRYKRHYNLKDDTPSKRDLVEVCAHANTPMCWSLSCVALEGGEHAVEGPFCGRKKSMRTMARSPAAYM
jgi:hypothetical protein